MITEKQQAKIRLLSDTELYPQAIMFMRSIGRPLPGAQLNGLLNVSLADTYGHLEQFIRNQSERKTWRREDTHIPDFYKKLPNKLKQIMDAYLSSIMQLAAEHPSQKDIQAVKMLLAREFIQHLLAENGYMGATRAVQDTERDNTRSQGRPLGDRRPDRGPFIRQGRP
jgi:hypothetical protein